MIAKTVAALLLGTFAMGCQTGPPTAPILGSARVVSDFDSYTLRRVGLVPLEGVDPSLAESRAMATTLAGEFATRSELEVLVLSPSEVSEVPSMRPHRDGHFDMQSVIELGRQHRLDALLVATLVERKAYAPQRIALQVDLVSTETGMSLWYGQVQADTSGERTKQAVKAWIAGTSGDENGDWRVVLLSPKRFYRFACFEVLRSFGQPASR